MLLTLVKEKAALLQEVYKDVTIEPPLLYT